MRVLDAESDAAGVIADRFRRVPISKWNQLMARNPTWIRFGTFELLIQEAERFLDGDPKTTCAITTFILLHLPFMPIPAGADLLARSLIAHVWMTHGRALLDLGAPL